MSDETTTEQLAGIEGQATEYTPPEGWRVLAVGEVLQEGDEIVQSDDKLRYATQRVGSVVGGNQRCIRRIEPQAQPEPQTQPEPIQVCEGQTAEYTPPDGWRVLQVGETLQDGDEIVQSCDGRRYRTERAGSIVAANQRYIRRIEPEEQPEPEPEQVQVREGRWRTRGGAVKNIRPCEPLRGAYFVWPWTDGVMTFQDNGHHKGTQETVFDLVTYLGPIEPQPELQPEPQPEPQPQAEAIVDLRNQLAAAKAMLTGVTQGREYAEANLRRANAFIAELQNRIADLETINAAQEAAVKDKNATLRERADEFRSEVSYTQNLLGESRQRVLHLEELVTSLRTINEAQEKAFAAANRDNNDLQNRLDVVAAEWATQAETIRRLQSELDAAQQMPQAVADRFEEGWNQGTARAVETIIAWLEPVRLVDSAYLANATMQHLPSIMRHLTGLTQD